jgi:helicase
MPPVKILEDQNDLVPTKSFPKEVARFPFENFNPVQSRVFDIYDKNANVIIAAQTSAGKTICAEMMLAHEVRVRGGKGLYLAPMRALAKEKIDDWTREKHHFGDLKISICTGDYRLTPARKKELEAADIIVMTSEMLSSRCRNYAAENNEFLKDIETIICDESHLLTVPSRGDHLEVGLMKFSAISPNCRIVFLSATMPNVKEIAEWVSYTLTGRETYLINSTYRPCPLGIHYETYYQLREYEKTEEEKVNAVLRIIDDYSEDQFIVFVHTKRTGQMVFNALKRNGVNCEYHNADLEKEKRHELEKKFRERKLSVVVATSTLAWGCNFPARRVIITGVHRGLTEIEPYDATQMAGRAGRVGYDPRGDVYILLPEQKEEYHRKRLSKPKDIESRLLDSVGAGEHQHYKTLAFHLVSEIHHGTVKTREDVHKWFERSFAHFQAQDISDQILDSTLNLLMKYGVIYEEGEKYVVTSIGRVASMFYYSPFDVADLRKNFNIVFEHGLENADVAVSMALGATDTLKSGFVSKAEQKEMGSFESKVQQYFGNGTFIAPAIKGGYAYFSLMNGLHGGVFSAICRNLQFDFPRTISVIRAIDSMATKWDRQEFFNALEIRVSYGVKDDLVDFCRLPDVGKVRAEKLYAAGFRKLKDITDRPDHAQRVLNMKDERIKKIIDAANGLMLVS